MSPQEVLAIVLNRGLQPKIGTLGMLEFDGDPKGMTEPLAAVVRHHDAALKRLVASQWTPEVRGSGGSIAPKVPLTPSEETSRFDWEAERLVRDLYATDHGLSWKNGEMSIFPRDGDSRLDLWIKRATPLRDRIEAHIRPRDLPTPETIERCKKLGLGGIQVTHAIELKHKDAGKVVICRQPIRADSEPRRGKKRSDESEGLTPDNTRSKANRSWGPVIRHEPYEYITQERWLYVVEESHPFLWEPPVLFTAWRYSMDRCEHWRMLWGRWSFGHNAAVWIPWGARRKDGSRYE